MDTREKQIELIKKLLKTGISDDAQMVLEKQFPEVLESEDERIRQTIIELIEWVKAQVIRSDHFTNGIEWDEMIAYLERQKEQKPIIYIPKFRTGDKVISNKNEHLTYEILAVGCIDELGNPEYKVEIFEDGNPGVLNMPHNIKFIECKKMDEWGRLLEQKPAEWSEEDEHNLEISLHFIREFQKSDRCHDEEDMQNAVICKHWLKSLRPQPHWKPSEEQQEVDLEKELKKWRHDHFKGKRDGDYNGEYLERESQLDLARHFYELGFNARVVQPDYTYNSKEFLEKKIEELHKEVAVLKKEQ